MVAATSPKAQNYQFLRDPLILSRVLWPKVKYYDKQKEIIYSVWHNKLTICVACNMLGKDFVAGRIALMFYLTRTPCRVITTSVDHTQLEGVLWGEIRAAIQESMVPLTVKEGGPLVYNHLFIRKVWTHGPLRGEYDPYSYMRGIQAKDAEKMAGHHIAEQEDEVPRTLWIGDEASGLSDPIIDRAETWFDRGLMIGNPYPCNNRFFREAEAGDDLSERTVKFWEGVSLYDDRDQYAPAHCNFDETDEEKAERMEKMSRKVGTATAESAKQAEDRRLGNQKGPRSHPGRKKAPRIRRVRHYTRKVIWIGCEDSPNVRYARAEIKQGLKPSGTMLVPGVITYWKVDERERLWDEVKKTIQLYGKFYKGAHLLLFPPHWLNASQLLEYQLLTKRRVAKAIGCDPGEGSAETAWYVVDDYGILDELALQTPDTSVIRKETLGLMRKWNLRPENIMFDSGGGGHQIADDMRNDGYDVHTVAFGETVTPKPKRGMTSVERQVLQKEEKYAYLNRRAHLYGHLSGLIEPKIDLSSGYVTDYPTSSQSFSTHKGEKYVVPDTRDPVSRFCIPEKYIELRRQLSLIPKIMDKEGRMRLPLKNRPPGSTSKEKTLVEILGCSPDRADALVVATYCRDFGTKRPRAGAA
jgi:hypothetical protein